MYSERPYREVWYSKPTGRVKEIDGKLHQEIMTEGMEQGGLAGISTFKEWEWKEIAEAQ